MICLYGMLLSTGTVDATLSTMTAQRTETGPSQSGRIFTLSWIIHACAVTIAFWTALAIFSMGVLGASSLPVVTALWIIAPSLILTIAAVPWRGRKLVALLAVLVLAAICVIGSASIGWFLLPALGCAIVGLLIPERPSTSERNP